MNITRKEFIKLSSLTLAGIPFLDLSYAISPGKKNITKSLFEGFKYLPNTARPFVRWWWNGNKLTEAEILRELDLLKESGIGGVEINSIKFPEGDDSMGLKSYDWLSDNWIQMVKTAVQGAKERYMTCDIIVGSGWPFGGKFLNKEEQTQLLTLETKVLDGPDKVSFTKDELLNTVDIELYSKNENLYKELMFLRLVPAVMNKFEPGMDLTDKLQQKTINIEVPEGKYVLYYLVKFTGYQSVINGAPGADGPVLNHYNKAAVEKYLNKMSGKMEPAMDGLGNAFRAMFCDSLELEGANWTSDILEEFKKKKGYDLYPYLPFILYKTGHMGNPVSGDYGTKFSRSVQNKINSVRYDFYQTRLELFNERFIETFDNWCHNHNVKSRVQAYGRGYHPIEASMQIDIPECETWLRSTIGGGYFEEIGQKGRAYSMINKFVSSGARLAGKRLVSCEEITNTSMVFNATLEDIKIAGDQSNLSGVTNSVLHGFNYSPKEVPFPGWVRYGTFFNERNPWWPYLKDWIRYKARLSYIFQNSKMVSDIAVMHPLADMWMQYGPQRDPFPEVNYPAYQHNVWEAIHQNGDGCDYISEKILQNSTFSGGKLNYGERSYKALILLEVETILPDSAKALEAFARAGGKIIFIGKLPHKTPSLVNKEKNNRFVSSTIHKIKTEYPQKVALNPTPKGSLLNWYRRIQQKFKLEPYVKFDNPSPYMSQVHYQTEEKDIFFFVNYSKNKKINTRALFNIKNKTPWLWNPEKGERYLYPYQEAKNQLTISLGPAESKLIVFDKVEKGKKLMVPTVNHKPLYPIKGSWSIKLYHVNGEKNQITLDRLVDFKMDPNLRSFAGTVIYQNSFIVDDFNQYQQLDLGNVNGVSEVSLNEQPLGYKWYGTHCYKLGDKLAPGKNSIEIKLSTVLGNYCKSLEGNAVAQRWTQHQNFQSIGLIGPVSLL